MTTPTLFGTEVLINTTTAGDQYAPAMTALTDGRFVATWTDWSLSGGVNNGEATHAQVFNADGTKSGAEFLVNTSTAGNQIAPAITALTDGRFVVSWTDYGASGDDTSGAAVRAQVFTADGAKSGAEFVVNTSTAGSQGGPAITALADGRFVVSWTDQSPSGGDTSGYAVRAQVFNADGTRVGSEFRVNTTTSGDQFWSAITALADGRFVVSWQDDSASGGDTSASAVRAQVFNANGSKSGAEFLVNTNTANYQYDPAITALADGRFVVSWTDGSADGGDTSGAAIHAQVFNADGTKSGAEFRANTTTTDEQDEPAITALADGRFVVSWTDHSWSGGDTSGAAVRGQIFDPRLAAVNLTGTLADDAFHGTAFGDRMAGGQGRDSLFGAGSDDRLVGGGGRDALDGGSGNDRLIGGTGKDILTGGSHADVFVFTTAADTALGTSRDRITDFQAGSDTLDFSAFMAGGSFIGAAPLTPGHGPQLRYSAAGILSGDADGDGITDFQLALLGAPALTAADILF